MPSDLYAVLGVEPDAPLAKIKTAYKKQVRRVAVPPHGGSWRLTKAGAAVAPGSGAAA